MTADNDNESSANQETQLLLEPERENVQVREIAVSPVDITNVSWTRDMIEFFLDETFSVESCQEMIEDAKKLYYEN